MSDAEANNESLEKPIEKKKKKYNKEVVMANLKKAQEKQKLLNAEKKKAKLEEKTVIKKENKITRLTKQLSELKPDLLSPKAKSPKKTKHHPVKERKRPDTSSSESSDSSESSESEHEVIVVRKRGKPRRETIKEHIEYSQPKEIKERYIPPPRDDRPKINFS